VQARNVPGAWALSHLHSHDPVTESAFYATIFGWKQEQFNTASKVEIHLALDGIRVATTSKVEGLSNEPPSWLVVFGTANLTEAVTVAENLRGAVVTEFDHLGSRVVVMNDDQGALFGLCQPA
jgi:predicted enzyme related to lactoylglutathione lyase